MGLRLAVTGRSFTNRREHVDYDEWGTRETLGMNSWLLEVTRLSQGL
jgi:hypothetical protein